jgi:hypothetical protein
MWNWLTDLFQSNYVSRLEQYILSKYPQNAGDVERLTQEYARWASQSWI